SVTQVVQIDPQPLASAPLSKRTPISPEHTQDPPRGCDWRSSRFLFRESVSQRCGGGIGARLDQSIRRGVFHQSDGGVEAEPCGIAPGLGCEVRLWGWHRMLLLFAGRSVAKEKAPSDAGGAW